MSRFSLKSLVNTSLTAIDATWPLAPPLYGFGWMTSLVIRARTLTEPPDPAVITALVVTAVFCLASLLGQGVARYTRRAYTCGLQLWPFKGKFQRSMALYQLNNLTLVLATALPLAAGQPYLLQVLLLLTVLACAVAANRARARILALSVQNRAHARNPRRLRRHLARASSPGLP